MTDFKFPVTYENQPETVEDIAGHVKNLPDDVIQKNQFNVKPRDFIIIDEFLEAVLKMDTKPFKTTALSLGCSETTVRRVVTSPEGNAVIKNMLNYSYGDNAATTKYQLVEMLKAMALTNVGDIFDDTNEGPMFKGLDEIKETPAIHAIKSIDYKERKNGELLTVVKTYDKTDIMGMLTKVLQLMDTNVKVTHDMGKSFFDMAEVMRTDQTKEDKAKSLAENATIDVIEQVPEEE